MGGCFGALSDVTRGVAASPCDQTPARTKIGRSALPDRHAGGYAEVKMQGGPSWKVGIPRSSL
jgi:hypothetical protein